MVNLKQTLTFLSMLVLLSCNSKTTPDGEVVMCTLEARAGILIKVFDKATGLPSSCGVTVALIDNEFLEELVNVSNPACDNSKTFGGVTERAGTYDIVIRKDGYHEWHAQKIDVSSNVCHVNTITVQAYLEKL